MRLMLHTLKKDARRLWPVIAVSWILLAVLTDLDRWRTDRMASSLEGWMNLLLPLAWACMIALAVLEEPLVGDRNFWTTRPHSRASLAAAKVTFAALAIHVPVLFADAFILGARGFSPLSALGPLASKQITVLLVVTLPALALATLVRNLAHFVIALFAVASGLLILNGGLLNVPQFGPAATVRHAITGFLLASLGLAVITIQYRRRHASFARAIAIAGVVAIIVLSVSLPVRTEYAFAGGASPVRVALRDATPDAATLRAVGFSGQRTVLILISVEALAGHGRVRVPMTEVEIIAADGTRIRSVQPSPFRPFERIPLLAFPYYTAGGTPEWLVLRFSAPAWERIKKGRVTIRGWAAVELYSLGQAVDLPGQGISNVPRLGRCTVSMVDDRFSEDILKVMCEQPRRLPGASVLLRHPPSGHEWRAGLNSSITYVPGPRDTWLSPLERGQASFQLTNTADQHPGSQWRVPKEYISGLHISVTPEIPAGHALVPFEFKDVDLSAR